MQTLVREDGRTLDPEDLRPKACKHTAVWVVNMNSARVIRGQCPTCAATGAHRTEVPHAARIAAATTRSTEMRVEAVVADATAQGVRSPGRTMAQRAGGSPEA